MMAFTSSAQRKAVMAKLRERRFVSKKIRKNIKEGRSRKQAIAIALSQARTRGFRIPPKR